jgi:hypothetical protein
MTLIEKKSNYDVELVQKFRGVDTSGLPEFTNYDKPLEMGLWVLWVAKEKLDITKLTAYQIADVLVQAMEVSIDPRAIVNSFNRAKRKVHIYRDEKETYYGIMKPGKDHLIANAGTGSIQVYYFEAGKRYYSKNVLANNILAELKGELKIVDPYCSARTLDILLKAQAKNVKFLTRLENLSKKDKNQFLRELNDFKSEHTNVEFRNYSNTDIHDRYVISSNALVILGYSMKDLGAKESFAVVFDKEANKNIFDALVESFNRRWKIASTL